MSTLSHSLHELMHDRQHHRILRLLFPKDDAPRAQFLVNRINATECLSRDFEFMVELLSDDADVALKEMQGKLLNIELVRKDGSLRYFSGYVFSFRRRHSDGGITFYEAKLGPWLKYLSLRKDSYLFHGKSLREQTEDIFRDYGTHAQWDWHVRADDPVMTDACQFNETDYNYLSRRWEAAGWHYWYEHDASGHKLIVGSDSTYAPAIDGGAEVRFHGEGGTLEEDAIDRWSPVRQAIPSSVALNGFNFKDPIPASVSVPSLNIQENLPELESYEYTGAYGFRNFRDGDAQSRIRMEEFEAAAKYVEAQGNDRYLMPGRWFHLVEHFNHNIFAAKRDASKDEFLILSVRHTATNNYLQDADEKVLYRNWLICTRKSVPWRPGRNFNSTGTRIHAPQTAIVVGPSGHDSIHTDEYGRVRVQFHWDREGNNDERSSAWIRVSSSWAGAELGAAAIPRVGTEVIVQWLEGCPDHPIITGSVFNKRNMPPWRVPAQRALTGLRSRELAPGNSSAGRSNHLILDDTNGQIQAQLKSDHQHSQLSLGHITRIEDNAGRKESRGEGWELRTDGHGVARAAEGMLITTERRTGAQSSIKDMGETTQRLKAAHKLHDANATAALQGQAQESGQQHDVADALKAQNDAVRGAGDRFPELAEPHLVLASPAGIETTSAQSTHIASSQHTALTTGRSLSIATGESVFASIRETLRLFVHKAGMKLVAAAGKVTVQAQSDDIEIIANKVLSLISQSDWIDLKGKKGIRLHGGESMVEISDLVQVFTSRPVLFHGNLETLGPQNRPQSAAPQQPRIEPTPEQLYFQLQSHGLDGGELANVPYSLYQGETKIEDGVTDESGGVTVPHKPGTANYSVQLATGDRLALNVVPQFAHRDDPLHREQTATNSGLRGLEATIEKLSRAKNSTATRRK
ncbi:type VI secretion system Vgr family protein [Massilia sp.]|uniref:type VI secretion system Vgr family protein n=1 Tax=Massilia sp. TaxID=1882437 RepID=UPI00391D90F5